MSEDLRQIMTGKNLHTQIDKDDCETMNQLQMAGVLSFMQVRARVIVLGV